VRTRKFHVADATVLRRERLSSQLMYDVIRLMSQPASFLHALYVAFGKVVESAERIL